MPANPPEFRIARTCYDHLAGVMGVWLHDRLVAERAIEPAARDHEDIGLSAGLVGLFERLGIEARAASKTRRPAYACRDLTERRHHLGGALGAQLCGHMVEAGWFERLPGTRALRLTTLGREGLARRLGPLPALLPG